jgi:hypothetical protein
MDRLQARSGGLGGRLTSRKRRGSHGSATGVSEVRWFREHAEEERRAPTGGHPPKRIGRREPPGPPVSIIQGTSPAAKGRGASLEEMLGTNVARVLVVEKSGKQKSVERIGLVLRVLSQGRP